MAAIALQAVHRLPEARTTSSEIGAASALKPLDPDVVSAAIPAFFIGRNRAGLWVAREAKGRAGGLFLFERLRDRFCQKPERAGTMRAGISRRDLRGSTSRTRAIHSSRWQHDGWTQPSDIWPARRGNDMIELKIVVLVALMGALLLGMRVTANPASDG
ncbi:hypothetical protein ACVOMS_16640 [Bradyrhizobium guangxiense]